jgi:hypothetical protein
LIDDPYFLAQLRVKRVSGFWLQHNNAHGEPKRFLSLFVLLQIAIQISARERNNHWPFWMPSMKPFYGLTTAAGVKSNHQIQGFCLVLLKDGHAVTQASQHPCPAKGCHPITIS